MHHHQPAIQRGPLGYLQPATVTEPVNHLLGTGAHFFDNQATVLYRLTQGLHAHLFADLQGALLPEPFKMPIIKNNLTVLVKEDKAVADTFNRIQDRKSTRLNSSHVRISYAVF